MSNDRAWLLNDVEHSILNSTWDGFNWLIEGAGLYAWGYNGPGQLGDGTTTNKSSPVQIAGTTWSQAAGGYYHTVAVKTDGTLWVWGRNQYGKLGDGTIVDKTSPVQISGGWWKFVACGNEHVLAIK